MSMFNKLFNKLFSKSSKPSPWTKEDYNLFQLALQDDLKSSKSQVASLAGQELATLSSALELSRKECAEMELKLSTLRTELYESKCEISELKGREIDRAGVRDRLACTIEAQKKEITRVGADVTEVHQYLSGIIEEQKRKGEILLRHHTSLGKQNQTLLEDNKRLERELTMIKADKNELFDNMEYALKAERKENEQLKQEVADLKAKNEQLSKDFSHMASNFRSLAEVV